MKAFKSYKVYFLVLLLGVVAFSCLEDKGYTDIVNGVGASNRILSWYGGNGSSANKTVALPSGETVSDYVVTVSATGSTKIKNEVTVTVEVDQSTLDAVNASITKAADKFALLPDDAWDFVSSTVTIGADTTEAPFTIKFYQNNIDKSKNFMLPIKIMNQEGFVVASNAGTLKLTFIGNPIAGGYEHEWLRWNNATGAGTPAFDEIFDDLFAPQNATTIEVESGTGPVYVMKFSNIDGVLSNFKVSFVPQSVTDAGITITDGPKIVKADPIAGKYEFTFGYNNSSGAARVITDKFIKK